MVWRSNVRRKAQFPQAYHCSIRSSMLPEIDGVMGWTKASGWNAINYFFAVEGDITIRSVGWLGPQGELNPTCFYDRGRGGLGAGGGGGCTWHWISNSSGAGNASLSLSPSHIDQCFSLALSFHLACVSLSLFLLFGSNSNWILCKTNTFELTTSQFLRKCDYHCYFLSIYIFECNMFILLGWSQEYLQHLQLQGLTGLNFIYHIDSGPVENNIASLPYTSLVSHSPEL